jgi:ketosteroid isomerase-like protein
VDGLLRQPRSTLTDHQELSMHASPIKQSSAEAVLERLNEEYIDAFMGADVAWYRDHLAEEFICIEADGSVLDKSEFLRMSGEDPGVTRYDLEDVRIRIYDTVALVQATGQFTRADGSTGTSRYTDVYARRGEDWKVVTAQITRASGG